MLKYYRETALWQEPVQNRQARKGAAEPGNLGICSLTLLPSNYYVLYYPC